jgi:Na+/proline symporter
MLLTAGYSALAGLWGVAVTDAFQFIFAMAGCVALSVVVLDLPAIGGLEGLARQLPEWALGFFPAVGDAAPAAAEAGGGGTGPGAAVGTVLALTPLTFLAFVGVQWWASWYPGSEPGGGGYIAQRMMSSKDERHSLLATLWFTIAHYCVRPWPWIIVGLSTVILYPDLGPDEKRLGYVYAIRDFLPSGLRGVLVAAFFAAYMSTIATHLNWGCSYVINDCYRRFLRKDAPEKHYVAVSRVATVLLMGLSMIVTPLMDTISGAWTFIIEAGAGLGLVLLLRWYWWRINAWSEIAAMLTPLAAYGAVRMAGVEFPGSLFIIVAATTVVWIAATFLTRPVEMETLKRFFATVHPAGWWGPVASAVPGTKQDPGSGRLIVDWIVGAGAVYAALFGVGYLLFGSSALGGVLLAASVAACAVLFIRHGRK